jgi:hypothetical protein
MLRIIGLSALVSVLGACGGGDDGGEPKGSAGRGGLGAGGAGGGVALGGSGGGGAVGGVSGGAAGNAAGGSGAEGGEPGSGGAANGCNNNTKHATIGNLIVADVTWPAKTGISAGSGKIHIWTRIVSTSARRTWRADPATGEVTPAAA